MPAGREPRPTDLAKHSLSIAGHRTSVSLEQAFWQALRAMAERQGTSVPALVAAIDRTREGANLSSAIRVSVLAALQRTDATPANARDA